MHKHSFAIKITLLFIGDLALLYGALALSLMIRYWREDWFFALVKLHLYPFTFVFLLWILLFGAFGFYNLTFMKNGKLFLYRLLRVLATNAGIAAMIFYFFPFGIEPRRNLIIIATISGMLIFIWRYFFNLIIVRAPASRILFFGINKEIVWLVDHLIKNPQLGQKPLALITTDGEEVMHIPPPLRCFSLENQNLPSIVQETQADTIVVSGEIKENTMLAKILFHVIPQGVGVVEFSKFYETLTGRIPLSMIGEIWFLENLVGIRKNLYEFFKRGLDIVVTLFIGIPALFLFAPIACAIKLDSPGTVFFKQKRVGRNNKPFMLIKYRSMIQDAHALGGYKGNGQDMRHTRVGSFLRKYYLDELPQIWNVLTGEMSFVGPRPERPEYVDQLKQNIPFYEMRLLVPPGITGWAQVNMENDASVEDAPEKMQYDLYYIKNRSFVLDLLIILRTISAIVRRQGR